MRAYIVKPLKDADPEGKIKRQFAGSQGDASAVKKTMLEANNLKRTQVGVSEVEVPTNKVDLIAWLNKNAA
jgi:hypothetical protein